MVTPSLFDEDHAVDSTLEARAEVRSHHPRGLDWVACGSSCGFFVSWSTRSGEAPNGSQAVYMLQVISDTRGIEECFVKSMEYPLFGEGHCETVIEASGWFRGFEVKQNISMCERRVERKSLWLCSALGFQNRRPFMACWLLDDAERRGLDDYH